MYFVISGRDRPDALEKRKATRAAHLSYWQDLGDQLKLAGPYLDDNGNPTGSLIIIDVPSMTAARTYAEADPYVTQGVFESVGVTEWHWAVNEPAKSED